MFTLWYTVLSYKEYRDSIWGKLSCKKPTQPKETAIVCPLPPKKNEPASRIPVVEPPKAPSPQPPPSLPSQPQVKPQLSPQKPPSPQPTPAPPVQPKPKTETPNPPQKLDPPPKPPRSPSPHPIRAEAFDDIEYEEEEEEESEESSEPEEEDSVLATPQRKPVAKSVNEFIDREKTS